jgi:hypothetical protein
MPPFPLIGLASIAGAMLDFVFNGLMARYAEWVAPDASTLQTFFLMLRCTASFARCTSYSAMVPTRPLGFFFRCS